MKIRVWRTAATRRFLTRIRRFGWALTLVLCSLSGGGTINGDGGSFRWRCQHRINGMTLSGSCIAAGRCSSGTRFQSNGSKYLHLASSCTMVGRYFNNTSQWGESQEWSEAARDQWDYENGCWRPSAASAPKFPKSPAAPVQLLPGPQPVSGNHAPAAPIDHASAASARPKENTCQDPPRTDVAPYRHLARVEGSAKHIRNQRKMQYWLIAKAEKAFAEALDRGAVDSELNELRDNITKQYMELHSLPNEVVHDRAQPTDVLPAASAQELLSRGLIIRNAGGGISQPEPLHGMCMALCPMCDDRDEDQPGFCCLVRGHGARHECYHCGYIDGESCSSSGLWREIPSLWQQ